MLTCFTHSMMVAVEGLDRVLPLPRYLLAAGEAPRVPAFVHVDFVPGAAVCCMSAAPVLPEYVEVR